MSAVAFYHKLGLKGYEVEDSWEAENGGLFLLVSELPWSPRPPARVEAAVLEGSAGGLDARDRDYEDTTCQMHQMWFSDLASTDVCRGPVADHEGLRDPVEGINKKIGVLQL